MTSAQNGAPVAGSGSVSESPKYRLLLDVPSVSPALGFRATGRALAEIITDSEPRFAIGIFGGWGSGKTTLMQQIARCLDGDSTVTVDFSAWRYEREEHLIIPLLDTVREAVLDWGEHHRSGRARARETAATVGRAMTSILTGLSMKVGVPGAVELSFDANKALDAQRRARGDEAAARVSRSFYHASFAALRKTFDDFVLNTEVRRIVVLVDDLDRCLPDSALQVLESMKLFFDLPGFVFVVGLDNEIVQGAIDSKYRLDAEPLAGSDVAPSARRISGADYVKKIFQLPYRVTPVYVGELSAFLQTAYDEARLEPVQRTELDATVMKHLTYLVGEDAVNPREIKRYINAYIIVRKIEPALDRDAVLAWQTITFREQWGLAHTAFLRYGRRFASALIERVDGRVQTALANVDPELDAVPDDFLDYVSNAGPARSILTVSDLDRYIASGETVGSTLDELMLSAFRSTGEIQLALTEIHRRGGAITPEQDRGLRSNISGVMSAISSTASGVTATRISEDVTTFNARLEELTGLDPANPDAAAPLIDDLDRLARAIADRLQRLYKSGSVGGLSPVEETSGTGESQSGPGAGPVRKTAAPA